MAKFTKLNIGDSVASSGGRAFKKLSAEVILPIGYQLLEYIQSKGAQWIDTEFKPNNNTRVVTQLQCVKFLGEYVWIFGARTTSTTGCYGLRVQRSSLYDTLFGNASPLNFSGFGDTELLNIDMNKSVHTINTVVKSKPASTTFQTDYNMILFGLNNGGSIAKTANIKIYNFRIYDNDVLVRNFVPCINPNNEAGMYDLVTKTFFGNSGTGEFVYEVVETSNFTLSDGSILLTSDGQIFNAKEE